MTFLADHGVAVQGKNKVITLVMYFDLVIEKDNVNSIWTLGSKFAASYIIKFIAYFILFFHCIFLHDYDEFQKFRIYTFVRFLNGMAIGFCQAIVTRAVQLSPCRQKIGGTGDTDLSKTEIILQ